MILSMCLLVISTSKLDMINVIQICIQNDNSFILSSFRFNNNRQSNMQKLTQALVHCLNPYICDLQSSFFTQLKKYVVASKLKNIRKVQQVSNQYTSITNFTSIDNNYMSIRPLQNNYSSIKIINNEGFNYNEENLLVHELDDLEKNVYQKSDYIQKYFNQTRREVVGIESAPLSDYALKKIEQYNEAGMKKVEESNYKQYFTQIIYQKKNWRGKAVDKMKFTREPISSPITCLEESHHETAVELFNLLLKYDQYQIDGPKCVMAANYLNRLFKLPEQLIEEGYMQIIKQLKGHRFATYIKLFAAAAAVVKPPLRLHLPLLNYCISHIDTNTRYFTYIFYLLVKTFGRPRNFGISAFEVDVIMHMKKIPIIVDFPTQKTFYVECTSSVQDLIEEIVVYFELDRDQQYLINYRHGYLQTGNLLDGLFSLETKKDKNNNYNIDEVYRKFVGYKVLLIFKNSMNYFKNPSSINILYAYESRKYLGGIYKFKRRQLIDLACLKYYSENDGIDTTDLALYIPNNFLANYGVEYFTRKMSLKLNGITCTKREARRQFLRLLRKKDGFLAHIFQGTFYITDLQQITVKIALFISPGYLFFLGSFDDPVYKKIRFNEIKEWGKSRSQICFKYKASKGYKIAHVECQNQKLVNQIFQEYLVTMEEYFRKKDNKELQKDQKNEEKEVEERKQQDKKQK